MKGVALKILIQNKPGKRNNLVYFFCKTEA